MRGLVRHLPAVVMAALIVKLASPASADSIQKLQLKDGWALESSDSVKAGGAALSEPGADVSGWHRTVVPSTVLAALTADGVYQDVFFGKNLEEVPGAWPPPLDVSNLPMTPISPFRDSWWYRTEFDLPASYAGKKIWLDFEGINYKADIWMNGKLVADKKQVAGTYRVFEFDVTDYAKPGENNTLAVEVVAPRKHDLAITWVDWNPASPDRDMGLWRPVYITASGPVTLRHPYVDTDLDVPSLDKARLTVTVDAKNATANPISGTISGRIGGISFSQEVELAAGETREISFTPEAYPALVVSNPKVWWPAKLGEQNLYTLEIEFSSDGQISDSQSVRFGIRKIESVMNDDDNRVFRINGHNILIRGAGWAPDMMFRQDPDRLQAELRYVLEMNLNTVRLEGKHETDEFYDLCDEQGILVLAGWCCCHHWERWSTWDAEDYRVAEASERDQITRVRNHPCMLGWLNGSDRPPPARVERTYLDVIQKCRWPNPVISSATGKPTRVSGKSGVKMTGPYEWVPPNYWYEGTELGGAKGFNTETSPGPAVPPIESLHMMLPEDHLWPIDDYWNFHAGRIQFGNIDVFSKALAERYGGADSAEKFAMKSQAMTYEGERAMFEAFGRNKYSATGVIQWMLNDAWPSIIWHLYDYYLRPGGGYFGTRKACEPLHVQYSYDDRSVVVVNSLYKAFDGLRVTAELYDLDMTMKFKDERTVDVLSDGTVRVMSVPEPDGLTDPYFLKLEMHESDGSLASSNFYWLSTRPDKLDWLGSQWYYTPVSSYADYTGLDRLPEVEMEATAEYGQKGDEGTARVKIANPSKSLAFLVRLKVVKGAGGDEVLPVFWDDNYFSLLPGESREVTASYYLKDLSDARPALEVSGWNVKDRAY